MKNLFYILLYLLPLFLFNQVFSQNSDVVFERDSTFFKYMDAIGNDNIDWGFLHVPEDWSNPKGKKIKLAIAVLKAKSTEKSSNPVVFLEGGPGAGGVGGIWTWRNHPMREKSDIVLIDIRGVGYSEPRLCPKLGKKLLGILAKDQSAKEDEEQKVEAAFECKRELEHRKIDTKQYSSKNIARDLHALKQALNYNEWNVFGVSYGTHVAQVYAQNFPNDVKSLILDSSISNIEDYHDSNTSNYVSSLNKVFESCKNNPKCNAQFPNLEETYYATITKLEKSPITVKAGKNITETEQFTYNAEDFKVALQQALYDKNLIEVFPMLITEFNSENESTLSALVAAFSALLNMDYGVYYCMTCNEGIPVNSFDEYTQDANKHKKLKGGVSFYKSDFTVCEKWNKDTVLDTSIISNVPFNKPVLVFAGEFDPITPFENGNKMLKKYQNAFLVQVPSAGHCPSFSEDGYKITTEFLNNPSQKPPTEFADKDGVNFITDVAINGGVSKFANSLQELNPVFLAPLIIALLLLIAAVFVFAFLLIKGKDLTISGKLLNVFIILTSLTGIVSLGTLVYAILNTLPRNFYILAFGLPNNFDFVFILQLVFLVLTLITFVFYLIRIRKLEDLSLVTSIMFSFILISWYFYYWGFLSNFLA